MKTVLLYILCLSVSAGLMAQPLSVSIGSDVAICASDTVNITATATGGTAPYTYSWVPNATLTCDTCQTVGAYPLVDTDLIVTVTDNMGATASDTIEINVITRDTVVMGGNIIVGGWVDSSNTQMLIIEYSIEDTFPNGGNWFVAAGGDSLYLENTTTYRDTFDVNDPDFAFSCASNPGNGCDVNVHITIEFVDYCITYDLDTNLTFEGYVGIDRPEESAALSVYPNPASYRLNITADEAINNVEVFNTLGRKVMWKNLDGYDTQTVLDVSGLQQGVYLLHITTAQGKAYMQRIVRE